MKKIFLHIILILFVKSALSATNYGNEWINYDQYYYKIKIAAEGIYRIDSTALDLAGVFKDHPGFNPQYIQIFSRETEQYIFVEGESDGIFNTNDYVEFYANKNDGWLDSLMYDDPSGMSNPYYSLINDTLIYYLSISTTSKGKRMTLETDVNYSGYIASDYFMKEVIQENHATYHWGEYNSTNKFYHSPYVEGEGWVSGATTYGSSTNYNISAESVYSAGPKAETEVVFMGRTLPTDCPDEDYAHHITLSFASSVWDTVFGKFHLVHITDSFPASDISSSTLTYTFKSNEDLCNPSDVSQRDIAVGYIKLKYPHTYNFNNVTSSTMFIPNNVNSLKTYIEINNFDASNTTPLLYNLSNHSKIRVTEDAGSYKALLYNLGGYKKCYLTSENNVKKIAYTNIQPVSTDAAHYGKFTDLITNTGNYVIITHTSLIDEANEYKNFRDQSGYDAILVDIEELYGQFGGGVEKHPEAIARFADFMLHNWQDTVKCIFLIGKSIRNDFCRNNAGDNKDDYLTSFSANLIPTMGYPGSDNLMVAGIDGKKYIPAIPIGRVSATTGQEVTDYLNKAVEYEAAPTDEWMKKVVQFSGGSNETEQYNIKQYTQYYQSVLEDTLYGGEVFNFYKNTTVPVENTTNDSITDLFNNGINIVNLFAHAAGTMFSFGLTYPQDYENDGKYPLIIANSCDAGAVHGKKQSNFFNRSLSEQWILYPGKGAAMFIATVTSGQPVHLDLFTSRFFENYSRYMHGAGVGEIMKQTIEDIIDTNNAYSIGVCSDMTLEGDPALNLNAKEQPDLAISESSIFFNPTEVTADLDSFDINIIVSNIGRTFNDSFNIEVVRTYQTASSSSQTYTVSSSSVYYKDTITVTLPLDHINGIGLNEIQVSLDINDEITELNETNNTVTISLFVTSKDVFPIYPYNYAIVPHDTVVLKASTSSVFSEARTYIFQIDTTNTYSSTFMKEYSITQKGGVLKWELPFKLTDSTVYYWRVGPLSYIGDDNGNTGGVVKSGKTSNSDLWRESSFIYINNKRGWSQAHIYQFENDDYYALKLNTENRDFDFYTRSRGVVVYNDPMWSTSIENQKIGLTLDGSFYDAGVTFQYSLRVYVVDGLTLDLWETSCQGENLDHNFGQIDRCDSLTMALANKGVAKNPPAYAFEFWASDYTKIYDMLKNSVPDGSYYILNSYKDFSEFTTWPDSILDYFESLGAVNIRNIPYNKPYSFFVKKGDASTAIEAYQETYVDSIFTLKADLFSQWDYGSITSEPIGPARKWESLHWNTYPQESISMDSVRLTVYGINDTTGQEEMIPGLESISTDSIKDIDNLYTYIDASVYPYIKLSMFMKDTSLNSPAVLDRWQVMYEEIPEAALNPAMGFSFNSDTLQEGEYMEFSIAVENTSELDMDSLLISYYLVDKNNKRHDIEYKRQDSLRAGDTLMSSISLSTIGYLGLNSLWIDVNPADSSSIYDQLEQQHFNNVAQKSFYVTADDINPILDVTFDGEHIMDGELVSAKPYIVMRLSDENEYMLLNDTSLFDVTITTPSDSSYHVYFMQGSQEIMTFTPGDSLNNTFNIEYHGEFPEDGIYELQVYATDASNNSSGDFKYQISFEVINKSTITNVINYPNPFSTSTRFVFTLTGSEVPDYFKIQIMTVTGRVVREITTDEIGSIRVGNNISEFAWDGRDQFGDRLGNGLYLYRVITSIAGQDIEHRTEDGLDNYNYFKKGFGKMYLMR